MEFLDKYYLRLKKFADHWFVIQDKELRKEYYKEVAFLNFHRQKYFSYFLLAMGIFQLVSDIVWSDLWESSQITLFVLLDITAVAAAVVILVISYTNPPSRASEIEPWHKAYFYIYLSYHLLWATLISIIEARTSNSVPTYLIGVFAATTLFLHRSIPILIYLFSSLLILFYGLYRSGVTLSHFITNYLPTIILVAIAWIVSIILMNTRKHAFLTKKDIEQARDNLDATVKERTLELQKINDQLLEEIKERQKFEKNLKAEKKKVEEADRLKSVFLANMSHEIRTPLNGIIGFGDLLKNPELSNEKKHRYIEIIRSNGQQLLKLIDDLMDISMIESNQLKLNIQKFRMTQLFPDTEVFFKDYLRLNNKDHIIIINDGVSAGESDIIESDPYRVQQVLYNLLSNATKFTHEGHIRFGGKIEKGFALFYVQDTGIGINKASSQTIFRRFRQGEESASRSYGGTGLGLSISEGIIDLLGGMIWVDMSYQQGARFCFSLPTTKAVTGEKPTYIRRSLKYMQNHGVYISGNGEGTPAYFDHTAICNKIDIPRHHQDQLTKLKSGSKKILLVDLKETEAMLYAKVLSPLKGFSGKIIANINPNPENKQSLYELGCYRVYENPVNINLLLADISELSQ
ncbi:MAG: hypothetical protein JW801_04665 [Bacteroidales bacterium]|nr:hypothetical protein [Bacteroidales bacterium]